MRRENFRKLMNDMRGALLVVATVMTIITYQMVILLPEGVWQRSMTNESALISFYVCDTAGFTTSMSVILLFISGISLKKRVLPRFANVNYVLNTEYVLWS